MQKKKKKVILVWSYNYWFADTQYLQTAGKQDNAPWWIQAV